MQTLRLILSWEELLVLTQDKTSPNSLWNQRQVSYIIWCNCHAELHTVGLADAKLLFTIEAYWAPEPVAMTRASLVSEREKKEIHGDGESDVL